MTVNTAGVYILDAPYSIDRIFDYYIPREYREKVVLGSFVLIPFGKSNRAMRGVVFELKESPQNSSLKSLEILKEGEKFTLSEEMRSLALFMKEQTFCTVGDAVKAILPSGFLGIPEEYFFTTKERTEKLNENAEALYSFILEKEKSCEKGVLKSRIAEEFGSESLKLLEKLKELELLDSRFDVRERAGGLYEKRYSIAKENRVLPKGKKQVELYYYIEKHPNVTFNELQQLYKNPGPQLKVMVERKQLEETATELYRTVCAPPSTPPDKNVLSPEQEEAKNTLCRLIDSGEPNGALLFGVTGSGKTRVMKSLIDHVVEKGRGVIVLVPEISLTPQTVGLFSSFFGEQVAIIHSGLSIGERFDEWRRIKEGKAKICIGTRSAVFAPFENLGLIILDEEQEHTYKSDMSPRYHARDIARFRCYKNNALMLLASATPSVESYYKAMTGKYTLCKLTKRYNNAPVPKAILTDRRGENSAEPIGDLLLEELKTNVEKGEQSILFVGRRGYNNFATCALCGENVKCPHCSVNLTYHAYGRYTPKENSIEERRRNGYLVCHYCGYREDVPRACPSCGASKLEFMGSGTQFVENELKEYFPDVPILRLDADSTSTKNAFDEKLKEFREGKESIMLGTQMVTKGHDFPNVTLVGVVNADSNLYTDDYRNGEHTFSLITQVIGRAGRKEKRGRAIVQTYNPENPTLILASKQDYEAFYENEIKLRKALLFPPFCDILLMTLSSKSENELQTAVLDFNNLLNKLKSKDIYKKVPLIVFGPFEAPLYRLKDRFRMRFVLKTKNQKATRSLISELQKEFTLKYKQKIQFSADFNPSSL